MENKKVVLTSEGLLKIKEEMENRLTKERKRIADEIDLARQQGDLSENAAYHAAIKDKEFNEARISELEKTLKNSIVKKSNKKNSTVDLGEEFLLEDLNTNKKISYKLVGANESNPTEGKVSVESPVGKAVMGKKYGDKVKVILPNGETEFIILKKK